MSFNDEVVYVIYEADEDCESAIWDDLEEMRFRGKLECLLQEKIEHLSVCKNDHHDTCKLWLRNKSVSTYLVFLLFLLFSIKWLNA